MECLNISAKLPNVRENVAAAASWAVALGQSAGRYVTNLSATAYAKVSPVVQQVASKVQTLPFSSYVGQAANATKAFMATPLGKSCAVLSAAAGCFGLTKVTDNGYAQTALAVTGAAFVLFAGLTLVRPGFTFFPAKV